MTMPVRTIAFALPAVVGLACSHGSSGTQTAYPAPEQTEEQQAAAQPGMTAHEADQEVSGKVTQASTYSISIQPMEGEVRTLEIVPQTVVTVDGREATPLDIKEGQEVRATYNVESGRDVAIRIESTQTQGGSGMPDEGAGEGTTGSPDSGETPTPPDTGMMPEPY